jgi:hypothetical protein
MNPHSYVSLTKVLKTYNGEKTVSPTNVAGKLGICLQKD